MRNVIQQLAGELKADTIRLLGRTNNTVASEAASVTDDGVPL